MKNTLLFLIVFGALTTLFWQTDKVALLIEKENYTAGPFFIQTSTTKELSAKFQSPHEKIKVLIVPGHEASDGGTEFKEAIERDMNVFLGEKLKRQLESDGRFEVYITRDKNNWIPELQNYFEKEKDNIALWRDEHKEEMFRLIELGEVIDVWDPPHGNAPADMALRLYGITKWANEKDIDIMLHLHINDYPRRRAWANSGEYNGVAVYVPERQYSNASSSKEIADKIGRRLTTIAPISNQPYEDELVIYDQSLVALGRYNTADPASILIEYGYIYEAPYQNKETRELLLSEYANQTYLGLRDYFEKINTISKKNILNTYTWQNTFGEGKSPSPDVLAMQLNFISKDLYPPVGMGLKDCPVTGIFGPCTKSSVKAFQKQKGLPESGEVDEGTLSALRNI